MNYCPVFTRIGGHAYGTVYPGPIGQIISPHMLGIKDTQDLPAASSLCGACEEVCPVNIPIPAILQRLREQGNTKEGGSMRGAGSARKSSEAAIWRIWGWFCRHPKAYCVMIMLAARLRFFAPLIKTKWNICRTGLKPASRTLTELLNKKAK